ncbi:MAG: hypothetical protein NC418_00695 [Muribaculaceae bacterium]|nr:hypothetical protein [Muribaculaceae bacterium]
MKKFLSSLCACLCIFLVSSCSSDRDDRNYSEITFPGCFAFVTDVPNGADAVYTSVSYQVKQYYGDNSAEVLISGLKLPDGTSFPTMSLKGLTWTVDKDGWFVIKSKGEMKPTLSNYGTVPTFDTFELRYLNRYLQGAPSPGVCVRYMLNKVYSVTSAYARHNVYGLTESTNVATGTTFSTQATSYVLAFNMETRRLEITMNNSRFLEAMPTGFNIVLKNIPFTIVGSKAIWDVDAITPEIGGTPYPAYPISNLNGTFDFGDGLDMEFDCEPRGMGTFHVEVECDYANVPA